MSIFCEKKWFLTQILNFPGKMPLGICSYIWILEPHAKFEQILTDSLGDRSQLSPFSTLKKHRPRKRERDPTHTRNFPIWLEKTRHLAVTAVITGRVFSIFGWEGRESDPHERRHNHRRADRRARPSASARLSLRRWFPYWIKTIFSTCENAQWFWYYTIDAVLLRYTTLHAVMWGHKVTKQVMRQ